MSVQELAPTDATRQFFSELRTRVREPSLAKVNGTLRFDIADGSPGLSHWLVVLDNGEVSVSRKNARADCIVHADRATFDRMASGRLNAFTALLREAVSVSGDMGLLVLFQRLLPAPPRASRE